MTQIQGQNETVIILDFGSQYSQLIARRVREKNVYSLLARPDVTPDEVRAHNAKGIIFTGGPNSIYEDGAPRCNPELLEMGIPVLGICYGMQMSSHLLGAEIQPAEHREYGRANLTISTPGELIQ